MNPFHYEQPAELSASLARVRQSPDATFLAGGTGLLDLMKLHVQTPSLLVDVRKLPLAQVEELPDGGLRLGALARNSDVAHHPGQVDITTPPGGTSLAFRPPSPRSRGCRPANR